MKKYSDSEKPRFRDSDQVTCFESSRLRRLLMPLLWLLASTHKLAPRKRRNMWSNFIHTRYYELVHATTVPCESKCSISKSRGTSREPQNARKANSRKRLHNNFG